ncbi:heavy metal translocating P-type ATPase [Pleomorphomonas carboxyditropha]|uniref:P-type Zn(2+) transporter n=1 Tax=Pleomorphomonas carboxyditropha TaxID=2023338 RepID=A0A2G9WZS6_9HYPH|nr:heavy metal translocating P-type ATPase [Pleomorphomonas carboxyditropha]PIP00222.1 heavy metal translocating P-type ATPase [Pleomorphomonas carboxyditropha]
MAAFVGGLDVVHRLPGRLRLRYRKGLDGSALATLALEIAGVTSARANGHVRSLTLTYDPGVTSAERLVAAVAGLNLGSGPARRARPPGNRARVMASLATAGSVAFVPAPLRLPMSLAATAPVLANAFGDWRDNGVTSHALEGLAVTISLMRADYTAATTTAFMLTLGEYLEDSVARRADELLSSLLRPSSHEVWVLRDGAEMVVPAGEVAVGDAVVVGTGAVIPVDGTVLSGEATVNEAAMTGESVSLAKGRGAAVLSGTLVEDGRLVIYAEQVGRQTAAARIADYVEQCLEAKSEAQLDAARLADRLVPVVLKLAGGAWLLTGDWRRAASVLQADYACALKLATPVAFKSAMYAAGKAGILIKGASALERLAAADTFIFDKTGTLTTGLLEVTDAVTFDGRYTPEDLVFLAASVEEHYFHPLALAVVAAARELGSHHFDHQEVEFIVAHGVSSVIDGKRIVVGSRHFVAEDEGIDLGPAEETIGRLYRDGKTLLYIGYGGELIGIIGLKDSVRASSARTIARLRKLGARRILMLTGDHRERAAEMADALGFDGFYAELMPEDKAAIIARLNAEGARIAFVGDGINDAPALAGAHVGIAMQRGADIARLTADIALLEDDIERIADAKEAANEAMRLIARNYKATVWLNTAILGAAAFGFLSPVATAVLHNGTTLGILLNALHKRFSRRR